ncbi:MAG: transposase, partial [Rubrivivax sp.]
ERIKGQGAPVAAKIAQLRLARRWLPRDAEKIPSAVQPQLAQVIHDNPVLAKFVAMREELRQLWTRTNVSAEQLVADLQAWCAKAEASEIASLRDFSVRLRAAQA